MIKKLFSHTLIYGLAPQISKVASFFILPIITKDLTPLDFGVSGIMMAYTTALSVFGVLGLRVVLVNSFYKSPGHFQWRWRQIYGFLTIWNLIYALFLAIFLYFIIPPEASINRIEILLLNIGPLVFFGQTASIGSLYYQLKQQPMQIASRTMILGLLTVMLNLIFISKFKMGYMGWFWSTFIVGMLNNLSYWWALNFKLKITPIYNFKMKALRQNLKISLPTIPHYYSSYLLNSSDKMIMDISQISTADIGKYNAAYTIGNLFNSVGIASGFAIGPLMNERFKKNDDLSARNLVFVLQACFLITGLFVCIWAKELFHFVIRNDELNKTYHIGIVVIMAYCYRPMYLGAVNKLFYVEKTSVLWRLTLTAGIINVVLNLLLLPMFGYQVAAATTFVSFMFMGYAGYFYKTFREVNQVNYHPVKWLVATILVTVAGLLVVDVDMSWKMALSAILFLGLVATGLKYWKLLKGKNLI